MDLIRIEKVLWSAFPAVFLLKISPSLLVHKNAICRNGMFRDKQQLPGQGFLLQENSTRQRMNIPFKIQRPLCQCPLHIGKANVQNYAHFLSVVERKWLKQKELQWTPRQQILYLRLNSKKKKLTIDSEKDLQKVPYTSTVKTPEVPQNNTGLHQGRRNNTSIGRLAMLKKGGGRTVLQRTAEQSQQRWKQGKPTFQH